MPGKLDGRDIVRRLRTARETPAIYLSSYPEAVIESEQEFDRGVPFLHKPVARDELARCIRRLLDGE